MGSRDIAASAPPLPAAGAFSYKPRRGLLEIPPRGVNWGYIRGNETHVPLPFLASISGHFAKAISILLSLGKGIPSSCNPWSLSNSLTLNDPGWMEEGSPCPPPPAH